MQKLPARLRQPIVGLGIMIVMVTCLPAILVLQIIPEGAPFWPAWRNALGQVAPYAIPLAVVSALIFNFAANSFIEKIQ
ncbi:hypothetical protein [Maritalea porphyrae]|uniref:hypothetical protein n=1 Tax=Maritalea porphyrae TaxID=880732 RepID=UPI0022AE64DE|nr:hypothetical protein [Maritalea porphyrae]MCZ4273560.1 hypothetical protein [Maritalea porphyrae]